MMRRDSSKQHTGHAAAVVLDGAVVLGNVQFLSGKGIGLATDIEQNLAGKERARASASRGCACPRGTTRCGGENFLARLPSGGAGNAGCPGACRRPVFTQT